MATNMVRFFAKDSEGNIYEQQISRRVVLLVGLKQVIQDSHRRLYTIQNGGILSAGHIKIFRIQRNTKLDWSE